MKKLIYFLVIILSLSSFRTALVKKGEPLDYIVLVTGDTLYGKVDYFKEGFAWSEFYKKIRLTEINGKKRKINRKKVLSYRVNGYDYESFMLKEESSLFQNGRLFDSYYISVVEKIVKKEFKYVFEVVDFYNNNCGKGEQRQHIQY